MPLNLRELDGPGAMTLASGGPTDESVAHEKVWALFGAAFAFPSALPLRRPTAESAPERDWRRYLEHLTSIGLATSHTEHVRCYWARLRHVLPTVRIPAAGPTADGALQLAWDRGRHHVDLDIYADGRVDWFYLDRNTGETAGGEGTSSRVPDELHRYLQAFFSSPMR